MSANDLEGHEEDYEDMSVESEDAEGEEEEAKVGVGEAVPLPTIQLSFDNSRGGAWDDRELVNAYDIAMEEFHVSDS